MMPCKHVWKAEVIVTDMEDGTYKVDVQVCCGTCFKPLQFIGMDMGIHPTLPMVSLDGTEARLNAKLIS
jgi:hypothetical protein